MLWLFAVLVAIVSNLDNLTVGFAFGMRGQPVTAMPNLLIATITMTATAAAMSSGRALADVLPSTLVSVAGGSLILAVGAVTVIVSGGALRRPTSDAFPGVARPAGVRGSGSALSFRNALPIGVALSLNNLGTGVGAGVAGVSPLATTVLAGAFSLICVGGGSHIGQSVSLRLGPRAPLIGGIALIGLGAAMLSGSA